MVRYSSGQHEKKGFGFAYVKVTMEVAWCKQNVCMMFDLLGCQGAACCTAKVHEGTDEVLEGTAQEIKVSAGANLNQSTAAVCESTASVIRYLRTYCLLYQISGAQCSHSLSLEGVTLIGAHVSLQEEDFVR
ncbi:hypothetical protein Tco_1215492 [Tanacetum coccineum]